MDILTFKCTENLYATLFSGKILPPNSYQSHVSTVHGWHVEGSFCGSFTSVKCVDRWLSGQGGLWLPLRSSCSQCLSQRGCFFATKVEGLHQHRGGLGPAAHHVGGCRAGPFDHLDPLFIANDKIFISTF